MRRRSNAAKPDYLLSGHSHIASDIRDGGLRRINPGALYRASKYTVALLDFVADEVTFLEIPRITVRAATAKGWPHTSVGQRPTDLGDDI